MRMSGKGTSALGCPIRRDSPAERMTTASIEGTCRLGFSAAPSPVFGVRRIPLQSRNGTLAPDPNRDSKGGILGPYSYGDHSSLAFLCWHFFDAHSLICVTSSNSP